MWSGPCAVASWCAWRRPTSSACCRPSEWEALTAVAEATLAGALEAAVRAIEAERRGPLVTRVAVIGMGRLGGHEMGYASDADVLFVHEPLDGADDQDATADALAVANEMRRLMALPSPEQALPLDADLRPEGRQGPLVRTIAAYASHYERRSEVWEQQALLRAAPLAGPACAPSSGSSRWSTRSDGRPTS